MKRFLAFVWRSPIKASVICLFGLLLVGIPLASFLPEKPGQVAEPVYEGRTVSQWLYPNPLGRLDSTQQMVIAYLGSETIPTLRKILSRGSKVNRSIWNRLPVPLKRHYQIAPRKKFHEKEYALNAIELLGPRALETAPELYKILRDQSEQYPLRIQALETLRALRMDDAQLLPLLDYLSKDSSIMLSQKAQQWASSIRSKGKLTPDDLLWNRLTQSSNVVPQRDFKLEPLFRAEEIGLNLDRGKR